MAKFLTGAALNQAVMQMFEEAQEELVIISPYIKFDETIRKKLERHLSNPELIIIVVFGKNEEDKHKSLSLDDISFLTAFPNIEIRYDARLHAKYYANEKSAILTSLNLHRFSIENNIEAGVMTTNSFKKTAVNLITGREEFDDQATYYFGNVIDKATLVYSNVPVFQSENFLGLSKKYITSYIEKDDIDNFFKGVVRKSKYKSKHKDTSATITPQQPTGYCIRTKEAIPFNVKMPLSANAYNSWIKFKNGDYPEKYCHYSGEPSNGETSVNKPILRKNWEKSKKLTP